MTPDALAEALADMVRRNKELVADLALLRDTHKWRTQAHQRVIDENTQLRATLARCNCANSQEPQP